jgi:hypothetical protein
VIDYKDRHYRRLLISDRVNHFSNSQIFNSALKKAVVELVEQYPNFLKHYEVGWAEVPNYSDEAQSGVSLSSRFFDDDIGLMRIVLFKYPIMFRFGKHVLLSDVIKDLVLENTKFK